MAYSLPEPYGSRIRYLRRQFRSRKSYLSRWTSVPSLRLAPVDCPLIVCRSCWWAVAVQSLNICVWCDPETKPVVGPLFDGADRLPRRASDPLLALSHQRLATSHHLTRSLPPPLEPSPSDGPFPAHLSTCLYPPTSTENAPTTTDPDLQACSSRHDSFRRVGTRSPSNNLFLILEETPPQEFPDGIVSGETVASTDNKVAAVTDWVPSPETRTRRLDGDEVLTASQHVDLISTSSRSVDRSETATMYPHSRSLSTPTVTKALQNDFLHDGPEAQPSSHPTPSLELRRKRRMVTLRDSAPASSRSSTPLVGGASSSNASLARSQSSSSSSIPITAYQSHARSRSLTSSLGRRNRPYYHSIRKNMSQLSHTQIPTELGGDNCSPLNSSPFRLIPSRPTSPPNVFYPYYSPPLRQGKDLADDELPPTPVLSSSPSTATSSIFSSFGLRTPRRLRSRGFSVGDEAVMRIALARDLRLDFETWEGI